MHIELDGSVWRIVEFQHVKPGKGGAFVRTKVKSVDSGSVVDRTFRAGEKFPRVFTEVKNMQYLYDAGDEVVFMDEATYEQMHLPHATVEDELPYLQPSSSVQLLFVGGKPSGVQLPGSVELAVTETEPGSRTSRSPAAAVSMPPSSGASRAPGSESVRSRRARRPRSGSRSAVSSSSATAPSTTISRGVSSRPPLRTASTSSGCMTRS